MDNVTHTLIGAAFARALPKKLRRPEIYWASVLGNNMPDADFILRFVPKSTNLDYLVHHRGYTHTFLLAPVMGGIAAFLAQKIAKAPHLTRDLFLVGVSGAFLHISADFMNSYGVHPFSPFVNRWFYGDSVYIVEPLIWFALIPFIAIHAERRWAKISWWLLLLGMTATMWINPIVDPKSALAISGFLALSLILYGLIARGKKLSFLVVTLFTLVIGSFFGASSIARARVKAAWAAQNTGETWLDISSNPSPGNPFCWSTWSAAQSNTNYIFRSATVSVWPAMRSADECAALFNPNGTAKLHPVPFKNENSVHWKKESQLSIEEWNELRAKSATFRKFITFLRFPYIKKNEDGSAVAGDLRYDRTVGIDFSDALIPAREIPENIVMFWDPPLDRNGRI